MAESLQDIPPKKILVWTTIREAFGFAWDYRRVLCGWIVLGACLTGLGDLVAIYELKEKDDGIMALLYISIDFLAQISSLLVFALLAVYCHRTFLIHQGEKDLTIKFFFSERERKFFAWVFGIPFCILLLVFPGIFVGAFIWFKIIGISDGMFLANPFIAGLLFGVGLLIPFNYILGRWILVFPAIAVDQEPRLGWSWKQTKGNAWRMFVLVGFLPLIVGNLWYLLSFVGLSDFPMSSSFLTSFLLFLFTPVEVAVISIAFRELTNWTPSSQLPEAT